MGHAHLSHNYFGPNTLSSILGEIDVLLHANRLLKNEMIVGILKNPVQHPNLVHMTDI
jgi:hypothetical protein